MRFQSLALFKEADATTGVSQHPAEFRMVDHGLVEKAIINHDRIPPAGAHSLGHILVDTDKDVDAIAFACILKTDSNRVRRAQCLDADDVGSRLGRQFAKGAVDTCRESKALDEPYEAVQVLGGNPAIHSRAQFRNDADKLGKKRRPIREIEILRQLMSRSEYFDLAYGSALFSPVCQHQCEIALWNGLLNSRREPGRLHTVHRRLEALGKYRLHLSRIAGPSAKPTVVSIETLCTTYAIGIRLKDARKGDSVHVFSVSTRMCPSECAPAGVILSSLMIAFSTSPR